MNCQKFVSFLKLKAKDLEWRNRLSKTIAKRLCEEGFYTANVNDPLISVACGWFWAKENCVVSAGVYSHMLKMYLDETYRQVAKENNW